MGAWCYLSVWKNTKNSYTKLQRPDTTWGRVTGEQLVFKGQVPKHPP